ncbi:MAG: hypothetical protein WC750_05960 [Patescibacteria group bacterium]
MPNPKFDEKFVDPNTGETVTRIKVPANLMGEIEKQVQINAQSAQGFLQISRQIVAMEIQQRAQFDMATKAEMDIGKEVVRIREKMGLDSSWIYNIPLKMVEKREPPPDTKTIGEGVQPPAGVPAK